MENFSITEHIKYNVEDFKLETLDFELWNGDIMKEAQQEINQSKRKMEDFETSLKLNDEGESEYTLNEYIEELERDKVDELLSIQNTLGTLEEAILTLGIHAKRLTDDFADVTKKIESDEDLTDNGKRKRYNALHDKYTSDLSEISKAQGYIVNNKNDTLKHLGKIIHHEVDNREHDELTVDKIMYINGMLQGDKSLETREALARKMKYHPIALELINKNKENEQDESIVPPSKILADEFIHTSRVNNHRLGSINTGNQTIYAKATDTLRGYKDSVGGKVDII